MCAAHHRVDNLLAIIDYNKLQSDDTNASIMGLEPLNAKFSAFGWNVIEIDGHDLDAIVSAFESAFEIADKPSLVIAHTIKGRGVPFMERVPQWHGSVKLTRQQAEDSLKALGCNTNDIARLLDVRN